MGGAHYWAVMRVMERRGDGEVLRVLSTIGLQIMVSALLGIGADRIYAITGVNSIFLIVRPYDVVLWDIPGIYYVIPLVCVLIYITILLLFRWTTLGFRLVASEENPELAMIQGANPWRLKLIAWSLSGGVACLAGSLFPPFMHIFPGGEASWIVPVMAVGVLCGFDSLAVAVFAAFAVGLFEVLGILWLQGIFGVWVGDYAGLVPVVVVYFSMLLAPNGFGALEHLIHAKVDH